MKKQKPDRSVRHTLPGVDFLLPDIYVDGSGPTEGVGARSRIRRRIGDQSSAAGPRNHFFSAISFLRLRSLSLSPVARRKMLYAVLVAAAPRAIPSMSF